MNDNNFIVVSSSVFSSRYSVVVIWPHSSLKTSTVQYSISKVKRKLPVKKLWVPGMVVGTRKSGNAPNLMWEGQVLAPASPVCGKGREVLGAASVSLRSLGQSQLLVLGDQRLIVHWVSMIIYKPLTIPWNDCQGIL